jgi:hypothetical protein
MSDPSNPWIDLGPFSDVTVWIDDTKPPNYCFVYDFETAALRAVYVGGRLLTRVDAGRPKNE